MADLPQLKLWLAEAEFALHRLHRDGERVRLEHDRRKMEFERSGSGKLETYIASLKQQIAVAEGQKPTKRGMRVYFG